MRTKPLWTFSARKTHPTPKSQAREVQLLLPHRLAGNGIRKTRFTLALPFLIGTGILITFNSIPGHAIPQFVYSWHLDLFAHIGGYLIFSVLLFRLIQVRGSIDFKWTMLIVAAIAVILSVIDEIHQIPIRNRNFDLEDLAADMLGIALGCFIICTFFRNRRLLTSR